MRQDCGDAIDAIVADGGGENILSEMCLVMRAYYAERLSFRDTLVATLVINCVIVQEGKPAATWREEGKPRTGWRQQDAGSTAGSIHLIRWRSCSAWRDG